jgi:TolB-like protein/two-component SAPR family response regulator
VKTALNHREIAREDACVVPAGQNPATESPAFALDLLGGFELRLRDGVPVSLPTRKAQLLLAYLALPAGRSHAREKLGLLLWGDRLDEQARGSLRNTLAAIRKALGTNALKGERDMLALAAGLVSVDVDRLAEAAAGVAELSEEALETVLSSHLLEGAISPSGAFDEWLAFERARCLGLAQTAAQKAISAYEEAGRADKALALALRLVALDPLREQNHRLAMRLFATAGERSRSMMQFQTCRDVLKRELGVEPSAETADLARRIVAGDGEVLPMPATDGAKSDPADADRSMPRNFAIAVLPFVNLNGQPEQDFMAEGFSEDLITELSRRRDFSVISRQSSSLFSGRPETAAAAAAELSVRYALAGSLRGIGGRLRVTAQLIDALGNRCIWAERYDRDLADIFAVQDEIVASIIGSLDAEVRQEERERAARKLPSELDAWEQFHRGLWHVYRFTREDIAKAEALFRHALERASDFALPHAGLGYAAFVKAVWYFVPDPRVALAEGLKHAQAAISLDGSNVFCHVVLGRLLTLAGDIGGALHHLQLATEMNPGFAQARFGLAQALVYADKPSEALSEIDLALRLSPKDPLRCMFLTLRSFCHFRLGDYISAEMAARSATQLQWGDTWSRLALCSALVELGRVDEAKQIARETLSVEPGFSLEGFKRLVAHAPEPMRKRVWANLRAAGLEIDGDSLAS